MLQTNGGLLSYFDENAFFMLLTIKGNLYREVALCVLIRGEFFIALFIHVLFIHFFASYFVSVLNNICSHPNSLFSFKIKGNLDYNILFKTAVTGAIFQTFQHDLNAYWFCILRKFKIFVLFQFFLQEGDDLC